MRAKSSLSGQAEGSFNASLYAVVSKDTGDMANAKERRDYLVAQGYFYIAVEMDSEMGEASSSTLQMFLSKLENYSIERSKGAGGARARQVR